MKTDKKSIFDINFLLNKSGSENILEDIEMLSGAAGSKIGHVLSKNINFDSVSIPKNTMVDLVKSGYNLPEADEPQKMLNSSDKKEEVETNSNDSKFRMPDLISKSYKLPEIRKDDLLK